MEKINLADKFQKITEAWDPKIIGALNGQHVKIAKFKGDFIQHTHADEDELFLVIKGTIQIALPEKTVELSEGEMIIIPKGVPHKPSADQEAHVLMFEPTGTLNTGEVENERTRENPDWI